MTARAYIGVGSNIDPERNVRAALRELARAANVVGVSTFYRTAPLGHPDDPWFVNGVVAIETDSPPRALKRDVLRHIEDELGRRRSADPNLARTIDLDLLLYEDGGVEPDAEIGERAFLAWPLVELDPQLRMPDGRAVRTLAEGLSRDDMVALPELTAQLRQEAQHG
jgi:2-amino-4-hydroxy-6-hydroxymethyldihydropteridine diphosphokinase